MIWRCLASLRLLVVAWGALANLHKTKLQCVYECFTLVFWHTPVLSNEGFALQWITDLLIIRCYLPADRAAGSLPSPAGVSRAGASRGRNLTKDGQNCLPIEFRFSNSCMRRRTGFNLEEAVVWFIMRCCWERKSSFPSPAVSPWAACSTQSPPLTDPAETCWLAPWKKWKAKQWNRV